MPLKNYNKKLEYSYACGVFPTIELLKAKKDIVTKVILNTKGLKNKGYYEIENICLKNNIPLEYDTKAINSMSAKENIYAICVFKKYESSLNFQDNHIVLVNPANAGNIGTVIRTMVGFGFKDLALIKPSVDIFDPKVVRSSMGGIFRINFEYFDSFENYLEKADKNRVFYSFMTNGDTTVDKVKFQKPFTLVFGSESHGLDTVYKQYGHSVCIPTSKDIDSLNLSVAVGIGLYFSSKKLQATNIS